MFSWFSELNSTIAAYVIIQEVRHAVKDQRKEEVFNSRLLELVAFYQSGFDLYKSIPSVDFDLEAVKNSRGPEKTWITAAGALNVDW